MGEVSGATGGAAGASMGKVDIELARLTESNSACKASSSSSVARTSCGGDATNFRVWLIDSEIQQTCR